MPRIEFHFNAPALLPYTCRLLRKVLGQGLRAQVVGLPSMLGQLDQMLWTFSAPDFLPHAGPESATALRQASGGNAEASLIISADAATPHQAVVNVMDAARRVGLTRVTFAAQADAR